MPFLDAYMPEEVPGYPCISSPRTKTTVTASFGGGEQRNQDWEHPLHRFTLPEALARDWAVVNALTKMWRNTAGPYRSFPWRDPHDFASHDLIVPNPEDDPVPVMTDQIIGTGDGITDRFQLVKAYEYGGSSYSRPIYLPVLASLVVAIDGVLVDPATYAASRPGGIVQFAVAPAAPTSGHSMLITAGYLFDVEVRFESDDAFEQILRTWEASGIADLTLIEVRPC